MAAFWREVNHYTFRFLTTINSHANFARLRFLSIILANMKFHICDTVHYAVMQYPPPPPPPPFHPRSIDLSPPHLYVGGACVVISFLDCLSAPHPDKKKNNSVPFDLQFCILTTKIYHAGVLISITKRCRDLSDNPRKMPVDRAPNKRKSLTSIFVSFWITLHFML